MAGFFFAFFLHYLQKSGLCLLIYISKGYKIRVNDEGNKARTITRRIK
jgi:hypothetical protein